MKKKLILLIILSSFYFVSNQNILAQDTVLYDESFSILPYDDEYYSLNVTATPAYGHIEIFSNINLQIAIFNHSEALKWIAGDPATGYFYQNVSNGDFYHTFGETGSWYVFLYNRYSSDATATGRVIISAVTVRPDTTVIFDQDFILAPSTQTNYAFWVYSSPCILHIELSATEQVTVGIMNETEAMKWLNGDPAYGYWYNNIENLDLYRTLDEYATWYIFISNRYNDLSSTSGHLMVSKVTENPESGVMFDQDFTLGPNENTNYVFWVYSSPCILHIELSSTSELRLFIFNETEAIKWLNGESATGYIFNNIENLDLYHTLYEYDRWYIVISNGYNAISSTSGHIKVSKVTDRPASGIMFDTDYYLGPKVSESYSFWVYTSPSILHIELSSDGDLQVLILSKEEAMKWTNGETPTGYKYHVTSYLDLYQILDTYDTWYLIVESESSTDGITGHLKITKVAEFLGPSIDQPKDITYEKGEVGNIIRWNAVDDNPASYTVTKNGVEIFNKPWDGSSIGISVDGLVAGEYTYVITVTDENGNKVSDTVVVIVEETTTTTTTEVDTTTTNSPTLEPNVSPGWTFLSFGFALLFYIGYRKHKK